VLLEKIPASKILTNKRLVGIQRNTDTNDYTLNFLDGSSTEAHIIVRCDGIKSVVRQYLGFKDEPFFSG